MGARFDYVAYKTRSMAEFMLEDMFATGEIVEGERPKIERREVMGGVRYVITLPIYTGA